MVEDYVQRDVRDLEIVWPEGLDRLALDNLKKEVANLSLDTLFSVLGKVREAEDCLDSYFSSQLAGDTGPAILDLLHPTIISSSYSQFRAGHYRDAVFNAFVAVFDLIRARTGVESDGVALVSDVLSLDKPKLVISTLRTESGRNEQKGFLQILQGVYLGIRNPKAHTLFTDLDEISAIQYLVLASLLARRIDGAQTPDSQHSATT
jgi:uncharacterized protein (TIGR02391 family)